MYCNIACAVFQGLNQDMRQHESTFAAEHLKMMANRNLSLENKVTTVACKTLHIFLRRCGARSPERSLLPGGRCER